MPSSPRTASDAAELERSRLQFEKMTQVSIVSTRRFFWGIIVFS